MCFCPWNLSQERHSHSAFLIDFRGSGLLTSSKLGWCAQAGLDLVSGLSGPDGPLQLEQKECHASKLPLPFPGSQDDKVYYKNGKTSFAKAARQEPTFQRFYLDTHPPHPSKHTLQQDPAFEHQLGLRNAVRYGKTMKHW